MTVRQFFFVCHRAMIISVTKFNRYTLDQFWNSISIAKAGAINGQFFNDGKSPTTLSFDVRTSNSPIYGQDPGYSPKKQIEFFSSGVYTGPENRSRIDYGPAPNIMVGLDPLQNDKRGWASIGRTFVCTKANPAAPMSPSQWFVALVSEKSTQTNAYNAINAWGCDYNSIVMFDGSGSAQLRTQGGIRVMGSANMVYGENRAIPQSVVISNN